MKEVILNGQPVGYGRLEDVKQQYPGAIILALAFKIDVITRK